MRVCSVDGCVGAHRARGLCSKHWKQEFGTATRYAIVCAWCGAGHMSARKSGYACTAEHRAWVDAYRKCGPAASSVPTGHAVRRLVHAEARTDWPVCRFSYKACVVCGRLYVARGRALTCPGVCREVLAKDAKRDAAHRRRARMRDAFVAPVRRTEIYKRDGFRCMLCHGPLMMGAVAPHPKSPTIDHVVALANGGSHEPANVQAAHFMCNSVKGARS